jgi:hypothetical protein
MSTPERRWRRRAWYRAYRRSAAAWRARHGDAIPPPLWPPLPRGPSRPPGRPVDLRRPHTGGHALPACPRGLPGRYAWGGRRAAQRPLPASRRGGDRAQDGCRQGQGGGQPPPQAPGRALWLLISLISASKPHEGNQRNQQRTSPPRAGAAPTGAWPAWSHFCPAVRAHRSLFFAVTGFLPSAGRDPWPASFGPAARDDNPHSHAVPSSEPERARRPSGEKARSRPARSAHPPAADSSFDDFRGLFNPLILTKRKKRKKKCEGAVRFGRTRP